MIEVNKSIESALEFLYQSVVWFAQNMKTETEYLKHLHTREREIIEKREAAFGSIVDFQKTMRKKIDDMKILQRKEPLKKRPQRKKLLKKKPKRKK